jgi:HlyD family secretion protein
MNKWRALALAIVVVALGVAGWWWTERDATGGVAYRTARIERGSLTAAVSSSGTVNPVSQVSVGSQVSGQIKELFADFNTEVRRNQLIARIDPESFDYKVRQSNADLEAARAAVLNAQANVSAVMANASKATLEADNAQRDLQRKQDLLARQFISQAEFEASRNTAGTLGEAVKVAQAQLEVARAQVTSALAVVKQREAALAQAKVDLERTEIRSPVDGVVIKRSVDLGQTVAASLQAPELFIIARNLSDMQVEASIDEADIARVRPAQRVSFTIDAFPGRQFEGRVQQVRKAAVSSQNVVTYTVVIGFANPNATLLPGMTANVRIITDTRDDVLKVANAALRVRIAGVEPAPPAASGPPRVDNGWSWLPTAQAQTPATPRAPAPGSALREFRERLIAELNLAPAQIEKIDALTTELRPRFAELRTMPEEERGKARERILAELRTRIGEQLTDEQKPKYAALLAELGGRQVTRGRIYLLGADNRPIAYSVRLGISDGVATELIVAPGSREAEFVKEGATVITGAVAAGAGGPSTRSGPRLMF